MYFWTRRCEEVACEFVYMREIFPYLFNATEAAQRPWVVGRKGIHSRGQQSSTFSIYNFPNIDLMILQN